MRGNCKDETVVKTLRHAEHPLLLLMALGSRGLTAHSPFGSTWTIPVPNQLAGAETSICIFIPYTVQLYLPCSPKSFKQGEKPPVFRRNCECAHGKHSALTSRTPSAWWGAAHPPVGSWVYPDILSQTW